MKQRYYHWMRHPRTAQELRANQGKNNPLVRAKRRTLPTNWDDNFIREQKSWKYKRLRLKQWRVVDM